jgi:uncharacterized protein YbaR (Trm112 family)
MSDTSTPQTGDQPQDTPVISQELLEILACPIDKSPVKLVGDRLVCQEQGHKYRIEDGIPIMLVDEVEQ